MNLVSSGFYISFVYICICHVSLLAIDSSWKCSHMGSDAGYIFGVHANLLKKSHRPES